MVSERFQKGPVLGWGGPKYPPRGGGGAGRLGRELRTHSRQAMCQKKKFCKLGEKGQQMAGRKKHRTLLALIDETGGVEKIFSEISNGRTIASIAREFQVSRNMLSAILNKPENRTQLREAQRLGAEQLADAALEIADNVPEETAAISKARERIAVRKWIASAMDPDRWNTTRANQQVQVNIHAQHLDALRKVQAEVIEHEGD